MAKILASLKATPESDPELPSESEINMTSRNPIDEDTFDKGYWELVEEIGGEEYDEDADPWMFSSLEEEGYLHCAMEKTKELAYSVAERTRQAAGSFSDTIGSTFGTKEEEANRKNAENQLWEEAKEDMSTGIRMPKQSTEEQAKEARNYMAEKIHGATDYIEAK